MNWYKISQQRMQLSRSAVQNFINKNDFNGLQSYLYEVITKNGTGRDYAIKNFNSPEYQNLIKIYDSTVSSSAKSNPSWAQWDIAKGYPKSNANDFKAYFTPSDEDVSKMLNGIRSLFIILQPIAQKYKMNLDFKIPASLGAYYQHNDRIVVHFSDQQAHQEILSAVNQWASSYGITLGQRTHTMGQDVGNQSYGQQISSQISNYVAQYAKTGKWNSGQLTEWVIQYFPSILKDIGMA